MAPKNEKVSNHIPEDVSFSILSKLPLKSLKRFTCVHKSWALLFENHHFMNMFHNNLISKYHSLYDDVCLLLKHKVPGRGFHYALYLLSGERFQNKVKLDWPPPFRQDDTGIHILGSGISGTLCLYNVNHTTVVLWNPAIEEFKVIPPSLVEPLPFCSTYVTLHGFGYDHVRDDYTIIRRVDFVPIRTDFVGHWPDMPSRPDPLWQIYSLRSNSWRKLDANMPIRRRRTGVGAEVYLNGVCHWWGKIDDDTYVVSSFNLSNEVFFTTPLPLEDEHDGFPYKWVDRYLVVLNESVAMISKYVKMTSFHISVLGELGVKDSWTKLFIVEPLLCIDRPIGTGKKGDIFFRKKDDELAYFDLSTQTIEEISVKGGLSLAIYKKNLLPIGGMNN